MLPATPADDGDDDEGGKGGKKPKNYKHLIKGIPGTSSPLCSACGGPTVRQGNTR